MLPTNEQVALWIDPERKRAGWWKRECPECGRSFGHYSACFDKPKHIPVFTGPDFTQPGPCAEFVEPAMDKYSMQRTRKGGSEPYTVIDFISIMPIERWKIVNSNHQHACILAMAEVMKNG